MKKVSVNLNESALIKAFVNIINKYPFEMDLRSGRYLVDAKSILGIFSLDLSKPIELEILSDDTDEINKLLEEIKNFIV